MSLIGGLVRSRDKAILQEGDWFEAQQDGAGIQYIFAAGRLAEAAFLTMDLILDGNQLTVFRLRLQEGDDGPAFHLSFGLLNQCSARLRMPMEAVNQNRWMYPREGALLKPLVGGQRVDPAKVDRATLTVFRKGTRPARWCMTPIAAVAAEPARLNTVVLPSGPLLDSMGQSTLHEWRGKSGKPEEVTARLREQLENAQSYRWPDGFSKWGGWKGRKFDASGFFRTHNDGRRWWLVDPDGYPYWSAGMDCVRVDTRAARARIRIAKFSTISPRISSGRSGRTPGTTTGQRSP